MNKLILLALVIFSSFGIGVFVGPKILSYTAKPVAVYEEAAVNVVNALQDEQILKEIASFARESKGSIKKCMFAVLKNTSLSEKELADMQACIAGYQELNDLFDGVNIAFVQEAWQSIAWEIVDGKISVNPASLNGAARKLAGQDAVIAPRLKQIASLNTQWADFIGKTIISMNNQVCENQSALFLPYMNFNTSIYKTLKKYPRVQELAYQVHACLQWQHTKQLFLLALKDELINRMPLWLPKAWPYSKEGIIEFGDLSNGLIAKHIKYIVKHAAEPDSIEPEDSQE